MDLLGKSGDASMLVVEAASKPFSCAGTLRPTILSRPSSAAPPPPPPPTTTTTPQSPSIQEQPSTSKTMNVAMESTKRGEDGQPPVKIKKSITPIQRKRQKATIWKVNAARLAPSVSPKVKIVQPTTNALLQVFGDEGQFSQGQMVHDTVSAFAVLKMRYLNIGVDVFGFGTDLCHTRFGAFVQRLSTVLYENCTNKIVGARIDHGSWSFESRKWSSTPTSRYVEPLALFSDMHHWIVLECLCAEFTVDRFGSLKVKSLSAYFHLENGTWALIDLSDGRLGHPLKILRALSDLSPKTHYPWPGQDDPLGCERAAPPYKYNAKVCANDGMCEWRRFGPRLARICSTLVANYELCSTGVL
ncbi:unnamed protein product, partial [Oikopleura dioica]